MPIAGDLKFSTLNFNKECEYLRDTKEEQTKEAKQHVLDLVTYCTKTGAHIHLYKHQIKSLNEIAHHILTNEVDLILPQFPTDRKEKRGIFTSLIKGFIGLAYEGISSFLYNRRHKVLHKAVKAMESKTNIQQNKLIYLEDSMVMYGVYSAETPEKLIKTVHSMHNMQTLHEKLFVGQLTSAYQWYINSHGNRGVQHYAIYSLLYLRMIKDKYVQMYNEFIKQLCMYAEAITILANGYLPI